MTRPIEELVRVRPNPVRNAKNWARIQQKSARRRRALAATMSIAAAAAVLLLSWFRHPPQEPTASIPPLEEITHTNSQGAERIALSDGSVISIADRSDLRTLRQTDTEVLYFLREGEAHFAIRPNGPRRWVVETGIATVEVIGTEFDMRREERALFVAVQHGRVLVRGERVPGRIRVLTVGQQLRVEEPAQDEAVESIAPNLDEEPAASAAPKRTSSRSSALEGPTPVAELSLLEQADRARQEGRAEEALALLARAIEGGGQEAPVAALARGRFLLQLGRDAEASADFESALDLGLPRALREVALARLIESRDRTGQRDLAQHSAEIYLAEFPEGRWAETARRSLPH